LIISEDLSCIAEEFYLSRKHINTGKLFIRGHRFTINCNLSLGFVFDLDDGTRTPEPADIARIVLEDSSFVSLILVT